MYAINVAESGAEEALIRLLRDPSYLSIPGSFEDVAVGTDTVRITVNTSGTTKTVVSRVTTGNYKRAIKVEGGYINDIFTVASWTEID